LSSIPICSTTPCKSAESAQKAAVTKALQEFIARREQRRVLDLIGKLDWDHSFDSKAQRSRK
jgi:hypothetical protein